MAVVLGSGWSPAAENIGDTRATVPMADVPGFTPPRAAGHAGTVHSVDVAGRRVLVLLGRTHAYEGHPLERVVHGVRTAAARRRPHHRAHQRRRRDPRRHGRRPTRPHLRHLNLTARSPLRGAQFVDMVDAYSPRLRDVARGVEPELTEGVYAGLPGPHYETPAEIRMLATLGADLVGMSTVHETIAARAAGLDVLGLSLVTNLAAGITGAPLDHTEVLAAGQASAPALGGLLSRVIGAL